MKSGISKTERGATMIESLIALLILAIGVLSLAGVQIRLLAESRLSNQRAVAIGLIDDMTNRILMNKHAAASGEYSLNWAENTIGPDCIVDTCTPTQLARFDLSVWRRHVLALMPGADATIFISPNDNRQIGIAIGWLANEGRNADHDPTTYRSPFQLTETNSGLTCPPDMLCQLAYVHP